MAQCATCKESEGLDGIKVVVLEDSGAAFDPPAEHHFCSWWCRNFFINANRPHVKFDREYGNTTATRGTGMVM
jgi:hypothetical protein